MSPEALTVAEAAEVLRISRSKLYELVAAGVVPSKRYGRARRISRGWVERWMASPACTLEEFSTTLDTAIQEA